MKIKKFINSTHQEIEIILRILEEENAQKLVIPPGTYGIIKYSVDFPDLEFIRITINPLKYRITLNLLADGNNSELHDFFLINSEFRINLIEEKYKIEFLAEIPNNSNSQK
ncbi:hypothetical protein ID858_13190 [Xenorhabdus sp. DI]|uniref:hypothetical protein n=1 Tax=Xenorhabdus doucetiae TaxID=351671 RepID=UPI0019CCE49A|nr:MULTISPECIES: hypothetical protein [unclassified Xenorhabdus]MBD2784433.1 hypothetical protein [Xenorhabdus sp. 3]MBD2789464.1 hypothetical protein [Xenorhabdus sp. DI]MBD2797333.1 hypothetical protein [Xenorhabdus sp. 18]